MIRLWRAIQSGQDLFLFNVNRGLAGGGFWRACFRVGHQLTGILARGDAVGKRWATTRWWSSAGRRSQALRRVGDSTLTWIASALPTIRTELPRGCQAPACHFPITPLSWNERECFIFGALSGVGIPRATLLRCTTDRLRKPGNRRQVPIGLAHASVRQHRWCTTASAVWPRHSRTRTVRFGGKSHDCCPLALALKG
jgi:hypothetical protein